MTKICTSSGRCGASAAPHRGTSAATSFSSCRRNSSPPGRVVAQVQLAHGCAGAQRGAHVLDALGQQVVVRHVDHRDGGGHVFARTESGDMVNGDATRARARRGLIKERERVHPQYGYFRWSVFLTSLYPGTEDRTHLIRVVQSYSFDRSFPT